MTTDKQGRGKCVVCGKRRVINVNGKCGPCCDAPKPSEKAPVDTHVLHNVETAQLVEEAKSMIDKNTATVEQLLVVAETAVDRVGAIVVDVEAGDRDNGDGPDEDGEYGSGEVPTDVIKKFSFTERYADMAQGPNRPTTNSPSLLATGKWDPIVPSEATLAAGAQHILQSAERSLGVPDEQFLTMRARECVALYSEKARAIDAFRCTPCTPPTMGAFCVGDALTMQEVEKYVDMAIIAQMMERRPKKDNKPGKNNKRNRLRRLRQKAMGKR